ncbi:ABC transporter substrate-binding protein [Ancylobacter aquaticus]|uniref:ABC transporter substrate-binding protein n=1 Tax=Ancylobacter aquaticus TaxID=100 RepID=UPI00104AE880|nr:ABC transporter substrate-binding protein [Ancylobacter aquaticus]
MPPPEIFPRALKRAEFDVTELSASSYLVHLSRGVSEYVALPVFLSRFFRFDSIYVRADRGIDAPADLRGKVVGTPEFQMTAGVWVRGILQEHFGLDHRSVRYVTGGLNLAGRKERIPLAPGPGQDIRPIDPAETLNALLARGEIDAVVAPEPPACFLDGSAPVRRLFPDSRAAEQAYFAASGIFPIMHLVAVRRSLVDADPTLAGRLFKAFVLARDAGYRRLEAMANAGSLPLMLPWLQVELANTRKALGHDHWPYGFEANRAAIEALCRYSFDQSLSARAVAPEELFDPRVLTT